MNWEAMGIMFLILAGAVAFSAISVYLIDRRGVHPYAFVGGFFIVAIIFVGVFTK